MDLDAICDPGQIGVLLFHDVSVVEKDRPSTGAEPCGEMREEARECRAPHM